MTDPAAAPDAAADLSSLFASMTDVFLVLDFDGRYLKIGAEHSSLYKPPSDLLGKTLHEVFPPKEAEFFASHVRNAIAEGRMHRVEYSLEINGKETWFDGSVSPMSKNTVLWIARDITAYRRAEERLNRQLRFTEAITANLGEGLYALDRQGLVTFVNPAAEKMLGWPRADMLGREMHSLVHFQDAHGRPKPASECELLRVLDSGKTVTIETDVFTRRDGTIFPVSYTAAPLVDNGAIIGAVLAFQDISERQSLENQLRQTSKLEAVGRLAGGVAHDFNNLLTIITGSAGLALAHSDLPPSIRTSVEEIRQASDRAAALTHQLLTFSRRQQFEPEVVNLNPVIGDISRMVRRLIGEDIELNLSLNPALWCIRADAGQVEQVILNLAVNARDAMPDGGTLSIETANITIDGSGRQPSLPPGRYAAITVSDTGCGMTAKTQSHIFEPFFTTKEPGKGTGLGLSTVYGIVSQSGGEIRVRSEPGNGATFTIHFPAVDAVKDDTVVEAVPSFSSTGGNETVLLTEDNEAVRRLMGAILRNDGYRVLEAADGIEAISLCTQHEKQIDLLITDLVLPKMNGREIAEIVQAKCAGIRILFISGYAADTIMSKLPIGGGVAFLQKPFTADGLSQKVRDLLDDSGC